MRWGLRLTGIQQKMKGTNSMDKIKPLFTATATAIGGRNGHSATDDGIVKRGLSVPKAMGGPGKPRHRHA
jgi:organic hydroperoxide reductase OsmC/OhrA